MLESVVQRQSAQTAAGPTVGNSDDSAVKTTAVLSNVLGAKKFTSRPSQSINAVDRISSSINNAAKIMEENSNKITEAITGTQKEMFQEFFKELRLSSARGDNIAQKTKDELYKRLARLETSGGSPEIKNMITEMREALVPNHGMMKQTWGEIKRQFNPSIKAEHFDEKSMMRRILSNPAEEYNKQLEYIKRSQDADKLISPIEEKLGLGGKNVGPMFPGAANGKNFRNLAPPPPRPKPTVAVPDKALLGQATKALTGLGLNAKDAKEAAAKAMEEGALGVQDIIKKVLQQRDKSALTENRPDVAVDDRKPSLADAVESSSEPIKEPAKMDWSFMDDNSPVTENPYQDEDSPYKEDIPKASGRDAKGRFLPKPRGGLAGAEELVQLGPKEKVVRPRGRNGQYLPMPRGGLAGPESFADNAPESGTQIDDTQEKIVGLLEKIEQHTDPDITGGQEKNPDSVSGFAMIANKLGPIASALIPLAGIAAVLGAGALAGYAINKAAKEADAAIDVEENADAKRQWNKTAENVREGKTPLTDRLEKSLEEQKKLGNVQIDWAKKASVGSGMPASRADRVQRATEAATPTPSTPDSVPTSISNQSVTMSTAPAQVDSVGVRPNDNSFIRFQDKRWVRSA